MFFLTNSCDLYWTSCGQAGKRERCIFFSNCVIKFIDGRPRILITRVGAESEGIL